MFDQLVEALDFMLKAVAKADADKLVAFAAIRRRATETQFTVVAEGELYTITVRRVE